MRNTAKALLVLVVCAMFAGTAMSATVTVDPAKINIGYMNVHDLGDAFIFGSGWGFGDLTAEYSGANLILGPNSIGDPNPYWYLPSGGPGSVGQKIMHANSYAQVDDGSLAGQTLTFTGTVLANTLTSAHVGKVFVRDFAPDFSSFNQAVVNLPASGDFTVSLALINDPARRSLYMFNQHIIHERPVARRFHYSIRLFRHSPFQVSFDFFVGQPPLVEHLTCAVHQNYIGPLEV